MNSAKLRIFFNQYWVLLLLLAVKFILQFTLVNPAYEFHRDEFLHLDQAFHPAAGFISVPPFTSWIAEIIYLLGGGIFWIRFFPALFGALTIVYAWLITEELGGQLLAKILVSIMLIFSVFARLNVLFQPNSFDYLAWTAVFYYLIKYINSQQLKWLLMLSVIIALGFYNKYNIVFLITGLIPGILLTSQRIIFTRKAFYLAMAFGIILILPNLIWQISNHFPVIRHMEALNKSQLENVNRIDFLADQLKYGLIGIVTLAALWALFFFKSFKNYRFIGYTYLAVMLIYTISRAKSYYAVGLYPVLFSVGAVYLEAILKKWKSVIFTILAIIHIVIFALIAKYLMPVQSPEEIVANHETYEKIGLLRWEDGKNHQLPQDFADMLGWSEMAEKTYQAFLMIPEEERNNTLIFCDNYGQTGALNYYNRKRMPQAYAFNTDYAFWLPHFDRIKNVIKVGTEPAREVFPMFREIKLVGKVENEFAREKGTGIYLLIGANDDFTKYFNQMTEKRKSDFEIF